MGRVGSISSSFFILYTTIPSPFLSNIVTRTTRPACAILFIPGAVRPSASHLQWPCPIMALDSNHRLALTLILLILYALELFEKHRDLHSTSCYRTSRVAKRFRSLQTPSLCSPPPLFPQEQSTHMQWNARLSRYGLARVYPPSLLGSRANPSKQPLRVFRRDPSKRTIHRRPTRGSPGRKMSITQECLRFRTENLASPSPTSRPETLFSLCGLRLSIFSRAISYRLIKQNLMT